MSERYDVIVVGVGGMGSATVAHLASRGRAVLGLERYDIPHAMGSSHGSSRIIRKPQYEDPASVPLVERAYEGWCELEAATGRDLLTITGGIDAGPIDGPIVQGAIASCEEHGLAYELLDDESVTDRMPQIELPADHRAVYSPESGILDPEACVIAHVEAAQAAGATIRAREQVHEYTPLSDGGVRLATSKETVEADRLVVTAGAWTSSLLPAFEGKLVPERQVLGWFQPQDPTAFDPDRCPVFVHETDDGHHYYGCPRHGVPGVKFGRFHHRAEVVDPDGFGREPRPADEDVIRAYVERFVPAASGPTMRLSTCLFTNSPDGDFVLGRHPGDDRVTIGAGFSGHGFKFAPVIGEILADLVIDGDTDYDIAAFRPERLFS